MTKSLIRRVNDWQEIDNHAGENGDVDIEKIDENKPIDEKCGLVETYLREVRRYRLLDRAEELELARAAKSGDAKASMKLAQGNLRFGLAQNGKALTVPETAQALSLSVQRIKRIECWALLKLRRYAQHKQLNAYLAS